AHRVIGVDAGKILEPRVLRRYEGADQPAVGVPRGLEDRCLVHAAADCLAYADVGKGLARVVEGEDLLGRGFSLRDGELRVALESRELLGAVHVGDNVDLTRCEGVRLRRAAGEVLEYHLLVFRRLTPVLVV